MDIAPPPITFDTAAHHARTDVPIFAPSRRVCEVLEELQGRRYSSASHIVVCDGKTFSGIATIEAILAAPVEMRIASLMDADAPVVRPGVDQEIAAWRAVRKGESALSVVDAQGRFIGLIPPHNLLAVLLAEHEEDLSRSGGFITGASSARAASEEPVERRFLHRLPWLVLGLAGALIAADLVAWFEHELERKLILAFFIPGVVYLADAVGTQTETIVVRGLSVGVPMRRMVVRELWTGVAIGIAIAVIAGPLVWLRWADAELAWSVGLSLFAACATASLAAMGLPWAFDRFDMDPAYGSGPLATVVQDLLSILIYFAVASAIIG
jgi:magnesium transporter